MRREPATVSALNVSSNALAGVVVGGLWFVLTAWLVKGGGGVPAEGGVVSGCWPVPVVGGGAGV